MSKAFGSLSHGRLTDMSKAFDSLSHGRLTDMSKAFDSPWSADCKIKCIWFEHSIFAVNS